MKHSEQTKHQAKQLYVSGFNFKEIAEQLKVNAKTVSTWKQADWDIARTIQSYNDVEHLSRELIGQLLIQYQAVMQRLNHEQMDVLEAVQQFSLLSESLSRAVNANKKLTPEVNIKTVKFETLHQLSEHIKTHHPQHLKVLIPCIESFLDEI